MEDGGITLCEGSGQRLVEAGTDLNWLEEQARKEGYRTSLEHVREILIYVELLNIDTYAEPLRKIERLLDQESYLLADEQWRPKKFPALFYQHLSNRAIELGQPATPKEGLVQS